MGDPRKQRKKFARPEHPWRRARLEEEKVLVEEYALKNKKDLWKSIAKLSHFKRQAKSLIARVGSQADIERKLFLEKLQKLGLIKADSTIDDILSLSIKDILERRLQTMVYRKGLCHSTMQARQFIVHGHIFVKGQKMNVPSYIVPLNEEAAIDFNPKSALADVDHPERQDKTKKEAPIVEVKALKTEEVIEEKVKE